MHEHQAQGYVFLLGSTINYQTPSAHRACGENLKSLLERERACEKKLKNLFEREQTHVQYMGKLRGETSFAE